MIIDYLQLKSINISIARADCKLRIQDFPDRKALAPCSLIHIQAAC